MIESFLQIFQSVDLSEVNDTPEQESVHVTTDVFLMILKGFLCG